MIRSQSKSEFQQYFVSLLRKSRSGAGLRRTHIELHRIRDQFELTRTAPDNRSRGSARPRQPAGCPAPAPTDRAVSRTVRSTPTSGRLLIASLEDLRCGRRVLGDRLDGRKARIVGQFVEIHVLADIRPELGGLHHHEGDVAVVGRRVEPDQRVDRRSVHTGREGLHPLTEVLRQGHRVSERPQAAAQQRDVHHRWLTGALPLQQRGGDPAREVGAGDGVAVGRSGRADHAGVPGGVMVAAVPARHQNAVMS